MPKLGSNRIKSQDRQRKRDNLMTGLGQRVEARERAEEKTRQEKINRHRETVDSDSR